MYSYHSLNQRDGLQTSKDTTRTNGEKHLVRSVTEEWLSIKRKLVKESTYACYTQLIQNHIDPKIGNWDLNEITESDIAGYLHEELMNGRLDQTGGLSYKTVTDIRTVLNMILKYAASKGYSNYLRVQPLPAARTAKPIETLSDKEWDRLEGYLLKRGSRACLGILISMYAGLRIGEVCGLQWKDVDVENGYLHVGKTVLRIPQTDTKYEKKTILLVSTPKTPHSNRMIPLSEDLREILKQKKNDPETYLLSGSDRFIEPRALYGSYKRILKKLGLPSYNYHVLRHSFASRCIENGFDVKSLSEIMGHSNVSITMDRYVHPTMGFKRDQMNRLKMKRERNG